MSGVFSTRERSWRKKNLIYVFASFSLLTGCSPSVNQPVSQSRPYADSITPSGSPTTHQAARPVPVVIKPAVPFRMTDFQTQRFANGNDQNAILPVSTETPAVLPQGTSFENLKKIKNAVTANVSTEIQNTFANYLDAFNRHDTFALAAHWVQDGENLDLDTGNRIVGKHAVKHVFDRLFARDDSARIGFQIDSIRPIQDDVAVVDGTSQMSFNDEKSCRSRFSAVLVRHEDRWLMESVREASASAKPTIHNRLQQLDWLRGFWEDISDGITASLQCEWNEQGTFLIRRYLVTKEIEPQGAEERLALGIPALLPNADTSDTPDRLFTTEYIGWNSQQGQICSWLFRSDGQMAHFAWQRNGNTWLLQSLSERNSNEIPAQYSLHRAGEDELTLEHLSGSDCALIPEADFLRTARPVENSMTSF